MEHSQKEKSTALRHIGKWETDSPVGIQFLWYGVAQSGVGILANNHAHPFYEIHFVLSGEVCYLCDGIPFTAREEEALLLPPNASHRFCRQDTPFSMAYLAFRLKPDAEALMPFPEQTTVFPFTEEVTRCVREIAKWAEINDVFSAPLIGSRFLEILHTTCICLGMEFPPMTAAAEDARVTAAKQYISQNRHCRISCEDVANACGISRKQLGRIFKKQTGKTLNDYLQETQLMYAEKLVLQGNLTIQQIGYYLGFKNESGFGVYFKRYFGLPPKQYREQFKNKTTTFLE